VFDNFENMQVDMVFKYGEMAVRAGKPLFGSEVFKLQFKNTMHARNLRAKDLKLRARSLRARVIMVVPNQLYTIGQIMAVAVENGRLVSDIGQDILKMVVVDRHKHSRRMGIGLVKGFGFQDGAIASTIAHDSHNIIAVGVSDEDIAAAVNEVIRHRGGMVAVRQGKAIAELPLPLAGLMSLRSIDFVEDRLEALNQATLSMGGLLKDPFVSLSNLAFPVIPELKPTDRGLVDVRKMQVVDLFL